VLAIQALAAIAVLCDFGLWSPSVVRGSDAIYLAQAKQRETPKSGTADSDPDKPVPPPEQQSCYREVRQSNCDCMKYRKVGNQFQPVDCVATTYCEAPGEAC
jgi:hypothetical protein